VTLEGQFLHYIHRHQFLDSPEWESLRPTEEGNFQVGSPEMIDSDFMLLRRTAIFFQILSSGLRE
jgi:hypothetical protein